MSLLVLRNLRLLDVIAGHVREGVEIAIEGDTFREVSDGPIRSASATVIDLGGRTVMPASSTRTCTS